MRKLLLLTLLTTLSAHGADKIITDPEKLREITDKYRSDPSRPNDFIPQGDGTVIDKRTGLQWMRCSMGQTWTGKTCAGEPKKYQWQAAMDLKETFAGHSDWRLPTVEELETLVYCNSGRDKGLNKFWLRPCGGENRSPTIARQVFPRTAVNSEDKYYLTVSPRTFDNSYVWVVSFDNGGDAYGPKSYRDYVRFVRGGLPVIRKL